MTASAHTRWMEYILAYCSHVDLNKSARHKPLQQETAMGATILQPQPQTNKPQRMSSTTQQAQQPAPSQPEQQDTNGPLHRIKTRALSKRETLKRRAPQTRKRSQRPKQQVQGHNKGLQEQVQQQVLRLVNQLVPQKIQQKVRETQEQFLQVEQQVQQTQERISQVEQQVQHTQERILQVEKQLQQQAQQNQDQTLQVQQTQGQVLQVQRAQEQILQVQQAYQQILQQEVYQQVLQKAQEQILQFQQAHQQVLQQEVYQQVLQQAHYLQQKNQESVNQMQQTIQKEAEVAEQQILRNMVQFVDPFLMARNQKQGRQIEELEAKVKQLEQGTAPTN
ncbi:uncharacterized protein ATNIH1004_011292 [Aspergillus tanneri]|uniref:Uncharacterized protein n=2 Tax=Aspergillus tanneri TaxID=1220188 RepID=A0A5M9M6B7_9EURO|nr:uncharacterized protein ATNIH1004_011292 [Aspergillus tanneri]KAA8642348.1 hypothetical protein ATNIH1004_011292 [Aspergillus tanneri]